MSRTANRSCWIDRRADVIPPRRREGVVESEMEGEAILFDPISGSLHRLNETAYAVWRLCDGRSSTRQMAVQLAEIYDLCVEEALDHVEQVVTLFAQLALFELSAGEWLDGCGHSAVAEGHWEKGWAK